MEAARRLFAERGYAATTIESIAEAAGLAVQTFYATYGSKRAVLLAMLDELDETAGVAELRRKLDECGTEWRRQLDALVNFNVRLFEHVIDLLEILRSAGEADPDVAALSRAGDQRRRAAQAPIVHGWHAAGALHPGLDERTAADVLWSLTSPELFALFVVRQQWPTTRYAAWLRDTLERLLFAD